MAHVKFLPSNEVLEINVSTEERASQIPSAETVGAAVTIFQRDGIVILKQVVDIEALTILNNILIQRSEALASRPNVHFNQHKDAGNISQPPPLRTDLLFETIWANPYVAAISAAILGPSPCVHFANGNTCLPHSAGRQTVHADLGSRHLGFPFGIVANFYLVDTDTINGSTEIWVGTHRDTTIDDHVDDPQALGGVSSIRQNLLNTRRALVPPVQPPVKRGDLVLRDVRLWHAGMPNMSETPRIMLAFGLFPWWYRNPMRLVLPASAKDLVEGWRKKTGLDFAVDYVDDEEPDPKFFASIDSQNPALVY